MERFRKTNVARFAKRAVKFSTWWVEEFGGPPLPGQSKLFEQCRRAYERGQEDGRVLPPREERKDQLLAWNEKAVMFEDYAEAMVGICFRFNAEPIAVYDMTQCLDSLIQRGLSFEEASDVLWTNDLGLWIGESTPAFVQFFR